MRKIVAELSVSPDGVVESPETLHEREGEHGGQGQALLAAGLGDELRLMVHPIVVGSGRRLFPEGARVPLTLTQSLTFATGVLDLTYRPA
ncbi:dihydrofolate reductase family protein [Nonomuraea typhae]|uniref:dihydrofolate reductase family protein n=1 Tax=Nonomuraea typhae TaxID=2603600 RepID=UPI0012F97263|nr:dihydrofolate reductase family protein [Nonomuraea typhae]